MKNLYNIRKSLWILFCCMSLLAANGIPATLHAQERKRLTVEMTDAPILDVLKAIEAQSELSFFYNNNLIDPTLRITVSKRDAPIPEVLNRVFAGTPYAYRIVDKQVLISKKEDAPKSDEPLKIQGRVIDSKGGPIVGATVVNMRTLQGTVTGSDGRFELTVSALTEELTFNYIGFKTKVLPASNAEEVRLEEATVLEDVVVVGYGTVKRVNLTGSVATIDMREKANQPITNTAQAMYNTPGVWINQNNAKPGADGGTIRIRGVNTLSSANPLVLLDGVEYDINEINPADIESISVLKDASAAIYGSKASNGVILITTKKGVKGAPVINYRANFGVQYATYLPDPIDDPILYMRLRNQAEINSGKAPSGVSYSEAVIKEYQEGMKTNPDVYPATNWFDICLKPAFVHQHDLRISGGTERLDYSMAVGYMKQDGVFIANDWADRISMDLKLGIQLNKYIKVGGSLYGNMRHYTEPGYGTNKVMDAMMRAIPIMSDYHKNGIYGSSWIATPGRGNYENPRMIIEQGSIDRRVQQLLAKAFVKLTLPYGITYDANFSFRKRDTRSKDHVPAMYTMNPKTEEVRNYNSAVPRVKDWDAWATGSFFTQTLGWEGNLRDEHHIGVMVGQDYQEFYNDNFQAYKEGFYDNYHTDLNSASGQVNAQATGASSREKLVSVFGRLSYDYKQRYLVSAVFRYDGSSRLVPDHRWAFFPSVSLAWRIDQENFMKNAEFIDQLKPRFSWGKMGNQAVSLYSYLSSVNTSGYDYSFDGTKYGGAAISALADNTITWEETTSYDAGIDFSAFGNRVLFSADWFLKRTEGILRTVNLPSQVGDLSGPKSNVGVVDNKGIELSLTLRDSWGDFSAGISGNFSYTRNEIVDLNGETEINGRLICKEGYPINSWYLLETDGVFQNQSEIDNAQAVYGNRANLRPGYVKYVNQNNDNTIDGNDRVIAGNTITWEETTSYDAGIDFSAFGNRVLFSADWFLKRTEGILRTVNLPSQVGDLSGPKSNVGVVDNKGIELSLTLRDSWGDFSAGISGNFSYTRNEIVDLNGETEINGRLICKEGYPINSWYLLETDGVFQNQSEIDNAQAVYGNRANLRPGYVKYVNQNNDNTIDGNDRVIAGNTIPRFAYGFNLNFGWKGFAVEAQFQGVGDVSVYPSSNMAFGLYNGAGLTKQWVRDSWSATNRNTEYPLLTTYPEAGENFQNSTLWLQDASYLRLKNIQLSYTFPKQLVGRIGIKGLQVYVSGQNLVTFSDFKIWDPEISISQVNLFSYPILKTISFGINLTL